MIKVYLENSRKLLGKPQNERLIAVKYSMICNIISNQFDWFASPELIVVRSQNRVCEILAINKDEYLIYDEYLSNSFDILNRLLYNSQNEYERYSYLKKITAEYLNLNRMDNLALVYAMSAKIELGNSRSYLNDRNEIRRMQISKIAEVFALSHELAHSFLKQNGDISKILEKIRHKALGLLNSKLSTRFIHQKQNAIN
ncbi:MAG: hypothetical protein R2792_15505 [Saprospiraceae bacterium]